MICIYCFHKKTSVTNSRGSKKDSLVWRRRGCENCGRIFSTHERAVMADAFTISGDSHDAVPYSRARLTGSLVRSFAHIRDDSVYSTADALADTVERELIKSSYYGSLSRDDLAAITHGILIRYDAVAGLQYAAHAGLVTNVKRRGRPSIK